MSATAPLTQNSGPLHIVRIVLSFVTSKHSTNGHGQHVIATSELKEIYRSRRFFRFFHFTIIVSAAAFTFDIFRDRLDAFNTSFLFFFFHLRCAIHDTTAHLSRFATMRVMLASKIVGATPQLPPCCIAAGCSPITEMMQIASLIHLYL